MQQATQIQPPLTTLGQETRWAFSTNPEHHTRLNYYKCNSTRLL